MGTGALSMGATRLGRESNHLAPSRAEVMNAWRYTSAPQYIFTALCLIKQWIRLLDVVLS